MVYKNKILLIVSGGIAAYKSLELVRLLKGELIDVIPVMTHSAKSFVTPLSLSVLSSHKVALDMYEGSTDFDHIELSRQVDLVVVAPCTANLIAKLANGIADDLASNILLATDKNVMIAPAMNVRMWHHKSTKRNLAQLKKDGIQFVGPEKGAMACGEFGFGRMSEPINIVKAIKFELSSKQLKPLSGKRILVTSGPTEEPIDPVRYISNRSSGIQGAAIAESLVRYGAEVIFVTGPVNKPMPNGAKIVSVQTAQEMFDSVMQLGDFDVAVCVAAVSDWKVEHIQARKIKKKVSQKTLSLELVKNPDILAALSKLDCRPRLLVGFAAETDDLEVNAKKKLESKNCDWILVNDVSTEVTVMGSYDTKIKLISRTEVKDFPKMSKVEFSDLLSERVVREIE